MPGRRTKKRSAKTARPLRARQTNSCRILVIIDQEPLRRKASRECSKLEKRVDRLRLQVARFETNDGPAFERWKASRFGPDMARIQELENQIQEKAGFIQAVREEAFYSGCTLREACHRVKRHLSQRGNPVEEGPQDEEQDFQDDPFENDFDDSDEGWDSEQAGDEEAAFRAFVREATGLDAKFLPRSLYEELFERFREDFLGNDASFQPDQKTVSAGPDDEDRRFKNLYRKLVRRLHPDVNGHDPQLAHIWHQVQEAYETGDMERLEMLQAMSDLRHGEAGTQTTLSQMLAVVEELREAVRQLNRTLYQFKKHPGWNFSRLGVRAALERKLQGQFDKQHEAGAEELKNLERLIEQWSRPRTSKRRRQAREPQIDPRQMQFGF